MKKILMNWKIIWFVDEFPLLEPNQYAEEAQDWEYEAWLKEQDEKKPHFVTFEIPYELIQNSQELKNKLVDIRLAYSQSQTITRDGITYLSHIDITDVKEYLSKEEFQKFKGAGIKFPPEVEALFADKPKNEKPTA